jgi:hypothetical protein
MGPHMHKRVGLWCDRNNHDVTSTVNDCQDIEPMLLDTASAARALAVSPRQVMRFATSGELIPTRLGPRLVRFIPAELQAFIARPTRGRRPRGPRSRVSVAAARVPRR